MFLIILTRENNQEVIKSFSTKEDALAYGEHYNKTLLKGMGTLSCISQVSEKKNIIHKVWL